MNINEQKLHALLGKVVSDFGAVFQAPLILIGDSLGLYRAMRDGKPTTPAALAERTDTAERYVREWLNAHAAAGYVDYHPENGTYSLSPEQSMLFAEEGGPAFIVGAFQAATGAGAIRPALEQAFRSGEGLPWHQHDHQVFHGTERFYRSGYVANLVSNWIPSISGAQESLTRGASVADIGCGHGASTLLMAQTFPTSRFFGFDSHAAAKGLSDRVQFAVAEAKDFPGTGYDLVTIFDALHDLGDPAGAAAHVRSTLKPDGAWISSSPMPRIGWRRTSIRLAARTSRPRRCFARLAHCHRKADLRSERRLARRAFERSSPTQGSAYSAEQRKHHSI